MTVPSQAGQVAFALQTLGKYNEVTGDGENLSTIDAWDWKYHKALSADLSPQQFMDSLPPEISGGLFTSTSYKMGAFVAGGMSMHPRLEDSLGILLYGIAGARSGLGDGVTMFMVDPDDDTNLPWMSFKRWLPGDGTAQGQLEYFLNCRIAALAVTVPQMGPLRTEYTFVGQKPVWKDDLSAKMPATFDTDDSIPYSFATTVSLPDFTDEELPDGGKWTGCQIILANRFTTPQQEMVLGSYYPDDFMVIGRSAMVRLVYKWKNPRLYRALFMQSSGSNSKRYWNPKVKKSTVEIVAKSPEEISGHPGSNYEFTFGAPEIVWTITPPQLVPNQMIAVEVTGIIHQANADSTWYTRLKNYATYTFS